MTVSLIKPKHIDLDDAVTVLHALAAERPDYVDPDAAPPTSGKASSCQYQKDGQPSCIVGHFLHRIGMPTHFLVQLDEQGLTADHLSGVEYYDDEDGTYVPLVPEVTFAPEAVEYLRWAQERQDAGDTWGAAVEYADTAVATI